jgi:hypothetical protein
MPFISSEVGKWECASTMREILGRWLMFGESRINYVLSGVVSILRVCSIAIILISQIFTLSYWPLDTYMYQYRIVDKCITRDPLLKRRFPVSKHHYVTHYNTRFSYYISLILFNILYLFSNWSTVLQLHVYQDHLQNFLASSCKTGGYQILHTHQWQNASTSK